MSPLFIYVKTRESIVHYCESLLFDFYAPAQIQKRILNHRDEHLDYNILSWRT